MIEALIGMLLTTSKPNKISDLGNQRESSGFISLDGWKITVDVPTYASTVGIPTEFVEAVTIELNLSNQCKPLLEKPNKTRLIQAMKYLSSVLPEIFLEDAVYGDECPYKLYNKMKSAVIDDATKYVALSGFSLSVS